MLTKLDSSIEDVKDQLKKLVGEGLDISIRKIGEFLSEDSPQINEFVFLKSRYNDAKKQLLYGIADPSEVEISLNKLRQALLLFIDSLDAKDLKTSSSSTESKNKTGQVLYQIPNKMLVDREAKCIVRIAQLKDSIKEGLDDEDYELKDIRVADLMLVDLLDISSKKTFEIRCINEKEQFIDEHDYTQWMFFVKPLIEGSQSLLLKVSVIEIIQGRERKRELVFEENIQIGTEESFLNDDANAIHGFTHTDITINMRSSGPITPSKRTRLEKVLSTIRKGSKITILMSFLVIVSITMNFAQIVDGYDWYVATKESDKESYEKYIEKHPDGKHVKKAKFKLVQLETLMWQNTNQVKNTTQLSDYLSVYPNGRFTDKARLLIDSINQTNTQDSITTSLEVVNNNEALSENHTSSLIKATTPNTEQIPLTKEKKVKKEKETNPTSLPVVKQNIDKQVSNSASEESYTKPTNSADNGSSKEKGVKRNSSIICKPKTNNLISNKGKAGGGKAKVISEKVKVIIRSDYSYSLQFEQGMEGIIVRLFNQNGVYFNQDDEIIILNHIGNKRTFSFSDIGHLTRQRSGTPLYYNIFNLSIQDVEWLASTTIKKIEIKNNISNKKSPLSISSGRAKTIQEIASCFYNRLFEGADMYYPFQGNEDIAYVNENSTNDIKVPTELPTTTKPPTPTPTKNKLSITCPDMQSKIKSRIDEEKNKTIEGIKNLLVARGNYAYNYQFLMEDNKIYCTFFSKNGVDFKKNDEIIFMDSNSTRKAYRFVKVESRDYLSSSTISYNSLLMDKEALQWMATSILTTIYIRDNTNHSMRKCSVNNNNSTEFRASAACLYNALDEKD